ncbi:pseudomurein-binding repeat-containing protein [Methanobacterium petrolearium]|uniref:pseudomurein-binding repeat-containing protein n=1 Tax=Methanobacterium petrolearium TaxID=710190 RepID=UPI001AEA9A75|nr:pseudomurein-binding repeat-containing protein [Methanobacterium petrolearium]MBP1945770.1 hypothetical protein [Methanobacterium petrolearium]
MSVVSATEENNSINTTNNSQTLIEGTSDNQTPTDNQTDPTTDTETKYAAAGSVTFTQDQIIEASSWVQEYIETNQELPAYVTINGIDVNMPSFLELLTTVTQRIYNKDTRNVEYIKCNAPTSPKDNQQIGAISQSTYISIAGRVQRYMDRHFKAPNYSSYSSLGSYFGYQNLIYTYSKILNTYNSTGSLPVNIKVMPWNLIVNFAGSFTIDETVEAAGWVQEYVETNQKLPSGVLISGINLRGESFTTTLNMPTFLKLLTTVTQKIYNKDTTATGITGDYKTASSPRDNQKMGTLSLASYVSVAGKVQRYMDRYFKAPNYSSYSSLGSYFGYQNLIYTYSKILNTYNSTGSLPADVRVVPWSYVVNFAGSFTIDETVEAAGWVQEYVETNQDLPSGVLISGTNLRGESFTTTLNMPTFLKLLTTVTQKIYNKDTTATSITGNYKTASSPRDNQKRGTLSLVSYVSVAGKVQRYMDRYLKAPNYSSYSTLGKYFGYHNLIYTYSKILNTYNSTGSLPAGVRVVPWSYVVNFVGSFTIDETVEAAGWVQEYVETNQDLPSGVLISGTNLRGESFTTTLNMPTFLKLLTTVTQKIYNKDITATSITGNYKTASSPRDNQKTGTLSLVSYVSVAGKVQRYMDRYLKAPNYSSYSTLGKYFGYHNLIYTYSKILNSYNSTGSLPVNIKVMPWNIIVNFAGTFTIDETVEAAGWVQEYVEINQDLPSGVLISGTNLRGESFTTTLNMPTFLKLLTTVTQKIYNKDTTATSITGNYKTASSPKELIHWGNMPLATYVSVAGRVQRYMDRYLVAPNYSSYSGLGSYFGYQNLIYTYSKILNTYNSTGSLPTTFAVVPWNKFTIDQVADAATYVKNYVNNNHKLPSSVTINGVKVGMSSFLLILTTAVNDINNNAAGSVYYYNYCSSASSFDSQSSGSINLDKYSDIAGRVQRYMERYWKAPKYSSYSNLGKYFGYYNMVYTFSRVMDYYDQHDTLPSSVGVGPWWGTVTSLGSTSYGKVVKIGPFGNRDSSVKIAYIIGVHPLESTTHQAFLRAIKKYDTSLDYCYYVYQVTVTKYASNYERGRMNGQLLAKYLVVPNIKKNKFKLAVDVHNNIGSWSKNKFIFSPVSGTTSQTIAWKIKNKISWLSYYTPPYSTSPQYVTIPLIRGGIPAVIVELYYYSSYGTQCNQMNQFVLVVDSLTY